MSVKGMVDMCLIAFIMRDEKISSMFAWVAGASYHSIQIELIWYIFSTHSLLLYLWTKSGLILFPVIMLC